MPLFVNLFVGSVSYKPFSQSARSNKSFDGGNSSGDNEDDCKQNVDRGCNDVYSVGKCRHKVSFSMFVVGMIVVMIFKVLVNVDTKLVFLCLLLG